METADVVDMIPIEDIKRRSAFKSVQEYVSYLLRIDHDKIGYRGIDTPDAQAKVGFYGILTGCQKELEAVVGPEDGLLGDIKERIKKIDKIIHLI